MLVFPFFHLVRSMLSGDFGGEKCRDPETLLLVARAIMAVLFGHTIHALREEYGESTITVKDAHELRQHIEELSSELSPLRESFRQYQEVLACVPNMQARLQYIESSTLEEVRRVKAPLEKQL
jgi:hypothetical protein